MASSILDVPMFLDKIFEHLEKRQMKVDYHQQTRLKKVMFVNHRWRDVAQHRFYREIRVGTVQASRRLLKTLRANSRLASYVKSAFLGTLDHDRSDTINHTGIILASPNLVHVTIYGWNGFVLDGLIEAIQSKSLQSLEISRYGLRDWEGDGFCTFEQLLDLMTGWPHMRRLHLHNHATKISNDWDDPLADKGPGFPETATCPELREVMFDDGIYAPQQSMHALTVLAPNVSRFRTWSRPCDEILGPWSPHLRSLDLISIPVKADSPLKADILKHLPQLNALEHLSVSCRLLKPERLCSPILPKLTTFKYELDTKDKGVAEELRILLESSSNLPALKELILIGRGSEDMASTCAGRDLSLTIRSFSEDEMLKMMEEMEYDPKSEEELLMDDSEVDSSDSELESDDEDY